MIVDLLGQGNDVRVQVNFRNHGLKEALDWRDGPFGDGRLRGEIRPRKEFPDLEK